MHDSHDAADAATHTLRKASSADFDGAEMPPSKEILADDRFTDIRFPVYQARHAFTARRYVDYLDSLSSYRMLPDEQRSALLADIRRTVEDHGGEFEMRSGAVAILGRTRPS